jgi:hypothetical protein
MISKEDPVPEVCTQGEGLRTLAKEGKVQGKVQGWREGAPERTVALGKVNLVGWYSLRQGPHRHW